MPTPRQPPVIHLTGRQRLYSVLGHTLAVGSAAVAIALVKDVASEPPATTGGTLIRVFLIMIAVLAPIIFAIVMLLRSEKKRGRR